MDALVGVLGFTAMLVGLVSVIYPGRFLQIRTRKTGATILGAGFLAFVIALAMTPDQASSSKPVSTPTQAEAQPANSADAKDDTAGQSPGQTAPAAVVQPTGTTKEPPPAPAAPASEEVLVTQVVDGDTIKVLIGGKEETVRLIGVDTPETVHPSKPVEPYGKEASDFTKRRLTGQKVRLELDAEERDHYGRLLAYVWVGGEMFNASLVKEGYAQVLTVPPNVKHANLFRELQQEAREQNRGLWGVAAEGAQQPTAQTPTTQAPTTQKPATQQPPATETAEKRGSFPPDASGECVQDGKLYIKGNRNSMIYHSPGGNFYSRTKAEECFYTAADAVAAGYRASKR